MKNYTEMTYDEQRAFLGLPDVRNYVAAYRFRAAVQRATIALQAFTDAFNAVTSRPVAQTDYVLARGDHHGR